MSNVTEILEKIEALTLLEAAELVKAMEEKFGVSAALWKKNSAYQQQLQ